MPGRRACARQATFLSLALIPLGALAGEAYSPHAEHSHPTNVYWGDTHVHTALSGDAFVLGTRLMPDDAYRFAKGEAVRGTGGKELRLRRPLDFLMVSDHAENLGVLPLLAAADRSVPATDASRRWAQELAELPPVRDILQSKDLDAFNHGFARLVLARPAHEADYALDRSFRHSVWKQVIANAQRHNDPGKFTAFIGFEWTARAAPHKPNMIHRNVLFAGGPDETSQTVPFSRFDSSDPADLWAYLQDYEDRTSGKVLAIPHNSNLSGGHMFRLATLNGQPFTKAYAQTRSRWEPIVEVTQTKGDGETHPLISPTDEFADYETAASFGPADDKAAAGSKTQGKGSADAGALQQHPAALAAQSHARSALKLGLDQEAELGVNPFKFGMIGSTDTHNALATANEDNFSGGTGLKEPSPFRAPTQAWYGASGYAAVWATENTREALFSAMRRREVYASTGPRIAVRFFGGWEYAPEDAMRPDLARIGYAGGVPMGGDLTRAPARQGAEFPDSGGEGPRRRKLGPGAGDQGLARRTRRAARESPQRSPIRWPGGNG